MSMFALYKERPDAGTDEIRAALAGNLCRCTGYQSVIDACAEACRRSGPDHFTSDAPRILHLLNTMPQESFRVETPGARYFRPQTLSEALEILAGHPDATVVAGATDVALRVTKNHEVLETVLDLSAIDELQSIQEEDGTLIIGAGLQLCRIREFTRDRAPALHAMLEVFAARQIRNVATIGGNLGTASPVGDLPPVLIAHDAIVVAASPSGERQIPASDFFTGYRRTTLAAGELIARVLIPPPRDRTMVRAYKVSRRRDLDIATVSGGFRLELGKESLVTRAVLAYGGMADRPSRAKRTEHFLTGKPWIRSTVDQAMEILDSDFAPISDVRGSAEFRRAAARNLLLKLWDETRTA
jgi:xanthine dehydrogenase small subunit